MKKQVHVKEPWCVMDVLRGLFVFTFGEKPMKPNQHFFISTLH